MCYSFKTRTRKIKIAYRINNQHDDNMNILLKPSIKEMQYRIFEETVFRYLLIKPMLFDACVKKQRGYALMLRRWIKEEYHKGNTAMEVARMIQKSKLSITSIQHKNSIHIAV